MREKREKRKISFDIWNRCVALFLTILLCSLSFTGCSSDDSSVTTPQDPPQTTVQIFDCVNEDPNSAASALSGVIGDTETNAKKVFDVMKTLGLSDTNIAGILGNWSVESGIDPTGVETIYDEHFQMGPKKTAAMADPQAFTLNVVFPLYAGRLKINHSAYIGEDGKYYPGIGLGGFTGPATTQLLAHAQSSGFDWYTMECQLGFVTKEGGYSRNGWLRSWGTEPSAASAATNFLAKWEGCPGMMLAQRIQAANRWYPKVQSWTADTAYANKVMAAAGGGTKISSSSGGAKSTTTRCDCEITEKDGAQGTLDVSQFGKGHTIDIPEKVGASQSPASVTVVSKNPYGWLFSGKNFKTAAEPCKTIFDKWKDNGGNWNDGLAALGNVPIVAVPQRVVKAAVGNDVFDNQWSGVGVGCFIQIFFEDGHSCVVLAGDTKNPSDSTAYKYNGEHWGHVLGSGCSIIEPWQSKEDYDAGKKPGSAGYHQDMSGKMTRWVVYEKKVQSMDMSSLKVSTKSSSGSSGGSGGGSSVTPFTGSEFSHHEKEGFQHGDLPADKVKYIVMHDTESGTSDAQTIANAWHNGPVAAHFIVDKAGKVIQCVPLNKITHHAGAASEGSNTAFGITQERDDMEGASLGDLPDYAMNAWSIGIEIVHEHSEGAYPEAQLEAVDKLVAYIDKQLGHKPEITDHKEWSGSASTSKTHRQGQGKQDTSDDFPLASYKSSRTHDGSTSGGSGERTYDCPQDKVESNMDGAQGAVAFATKVANSKTVGYSQSFNAADSREGVKNFDGKTLLNCDCTSFVWYCWMIGGKSEKVQQASPNYGPATGLFQQYYPKAGFVEHNFNQSELQPGDVLWTSGHAALYIGDGKIAEAAGSENGRGKYGSVGDQLQTSAEGVEDFHDGEVRINNVYTFQKYWRYTG